MPNATPSHAIEGGGLKNGDAAAQPVVRVLYSPGDGVTVGGGFRELVRWHLPQLKALAASLAPADADVECQARGEPDHARKLMSGTQF